jgi:hypothetical protein
MTVLYEFRMLKDYNRDGIWHLVHMSPYGLHSVCGHSRARFDNAEHRLQFSRETTLAVAETKILPGAATIKITDSDGSVKGSEGRVCYHCAHVITQTKLNPDRYEVKGAEMLPEQQMLPEQSTQEYPMLDSTKPIVVVNGSAHQAEEKTLTAAKALAKQLIGDRTTTATIYVPHTQVERPVPPLKSTRIKFE